MRLRLFAPGTVERYIAVPVSPSVMAHQLQMIQSQTANFENLRKYTESIPTPSGTCTALVSAQVTSADVN